MAMAMAKGEVAGSSYYWQLDHTWTWTWILVVGVTCGIVVLRLLRRQNVDDDYPPGPRPWPLVGSLLSLSMSDPPEVMFAKLGEKYGGLVFLWMGVKPTVVVCSARMAMEFLKTHDLAFSNRPKRIVSKYVSFNGTSFISMNASNPYYQHLRRMFVMELLSPKKIAASLSIRQEQMLKMVHSIQHESEAGRSVNLTTSASTLGINLSLCLIFGRRFFDMVVPEEAKSFLVSFKEINKYLQSVNLGDFIPALRWLDLQHVELKLKDAEMELRRCLENLIDLKRTEMSKWSWQEIDDGANERDIMSKLLSLEGEERLSKDQLQSVVFVLLAAGSDSVAKGIERAVEELMKQPHLMKRAVDELDEVVGKTRVFEESDIPNLPFLQNVVKETLRLYPPTQLLVPHMNVEQRQVAGYTIPANSTVMINLYALSRDPDFWDCPNLFSPDRFANSPLTVQGSDFHYIPFGYGRRGCPGLNLGMANFQHGLALLLQCFDWSFINGVPSSDAYTAWRIKPDVCVHAQLRIDPHLLQQS